jgi:predicted dehydrogenase
MTSTVGIAILGTGAIASTHIQAFRAFSPRAKIIALCDIYADKAHALAKAEGVDVLVFEDYRDALRRTDVHLVSICLPPSLHAEAAIAAAQAGKHVLIEKPMAASLEECDRMIAASRSAGTLLSVVAQNRFKDPVVKVKSIIDSGKAGRVLFTTVNSLWWRGQNYYDLWWRGTWDKEGGGCTLSHAVHHVDLLRWILGMPAEVSAVISNANHGNSELEDVSIAILTYGGGSLAQLTTSLVSHGEEQELVFQTERARLSIPWKLHVSQAMENGFPEQDAAGEQEIQSMFDAAGTLAYEGHQGQIHNVLNAIEGKERLMVDGEEGKKTLELILGMYSSAVRRTPVRFPIAETDPMYRKETMTALMPRFHDKKKSIDNFKSAAITLGRAL